jgi:hypothetical protein
MKVVSACKPEQSVLRTLYDQIVVIVIAEPMSMPNCTIFS